MYIFTINILECRAKSLPVKLLETIILCKYKYNWCVCVLSVSLVVLKNSFFDALTLISQGYLMYRQLHPGGDQQGILKV